MASLWPYHGGRAFRTCDCHPRNPLSTLMLPARVFQLCILSHLTYLPSFLPVFLRSIFFYRQSHLLNFITNLVSASLSLCLQARPHPPGTTLGMEPYSRSPRCSAQFSVIPVLGVRRTGPGTGGATNVSTALQQDALPLFPRLET